MEAINSNGCLNFDDSQERMLALDLELADSNAKENPSGLSVTVSKSDIMTVRVDNVIVDTHRLKITTTSANDVYQFNGSQIVPTLPCPEKYRFYQENSNISAEWNKEISILWKRATINPPDEYVLDVILKVKNMHTLSEQTYLLVSDAAKVPPYVC